MLEQKVQLAMLAGSLSRTMMPQRGAADIFPQLQLMAGL